MTFRFYRPLWVLLVLLAVLQSSAWSATEIWTGNAADVRQIDEVEFAGTWANGDTVTSTINGKDIVVTVGDDVTAANVATAFRDAWNSSTRLDGTGGTDATSNAGAQEFGEFGDALATVSGSVVTLVANTSGKPFTLTVTEATAGDGTATETTAQAATGKHFWNNGDNWADGSAPANDDTVILKDSNVAIKYGFPAATTEVVLNIYQSFVATVGLPLVNTDNPAKPYFEYRADSLTLGEGGTGTNITHLIGIGAGPGSPFLNISHNAAASGLVVNAVVYNTGNPSNNNGKALNLFIQTSDASVTVLKGSVNLGDNQIGGSLIQTLNVGYTTNQAGDSNVSVESVADIDGETVTVNQTGGLLTIRDTSTGSTPYTFNISGGVLRTENLDTSAAVNVTVTNGTAIWMSAETVTALTIGAGGVFDMEKDTRPVTITACDLHSGASLLDGAGGRGTYTNGIDLNRCGIDDVTLRVGNNKRVSLTAVP